MAESCETFQINVKRVCFRKEKCDGSDKIIPSMKEKKKKVSTTRNPLLTKHQDEGAW